MSAALVAAREENLTHHSSPSIERLMRLCQQVRSRRALTLSSVAIQACDTTASATSSVNTAFAARGYSDVLASSRNPGQRRRHPDRLRGPLPKTKTYLDGSAIDTTATCPPPPPPVPSSLANADSGPIAQTAELLGQTRDGQTVGRPNSGIGQTPDWTARAPREGGSSCQISQMPVCATAASPG